MGADEIGKRRAGDIRAFAARGAVRESQNPKPIKTNPFDITYKTLIVMGSVWINLEGFYKILDHKRI